MKFLNKVATVVGYVTMAVGLGMVAKAAAMTVKQVIEEKTMTPVQPDDYYFDGGLDE